VRTVLIICSWFCLATTWQGASGQAFQKIYTNDQAVLFYLQDLFVDANQNCFATGAKEDTTTALIAIKTDSDGVPLWSFQYHPENPPDYFQNGFSIHGLPDGGAVVAGNEDNSITTIGGILLKIAPDGLPVWGKFCPFASANGKVTANASEICYADIDRSIKRVYICKLDFDGNIQWERLLEAGNMDMYHIESLLFDEATDEIVMVLNVAKLLPNNGGFAPPNSILIRFGQYGQIKHAAFFHNVQLSSMVSMPNGRLGFRCSPSDVSWTAVGMLDASFHTVWLKKLWLPNSIVVPNDISHYLSISADKSRLYAIANTSGGEKLSVCLDTTGIIIEKHAFFSKISGETTATAAGKGFTRGSYIRQNAFAITRSDSAGITPNCTFLQPCGLLTTDTLLMPDTVSWTLITTHLLAPEPVTATAYPLHVEDDCYDPGTINAAFDVSDTVICAGGTVSVSRLAGNGALPFGISSWRLPGATPAVSNAAAIKQIRYDQAGIYKITHYFSVAGCKDSAMSTIRVLAPSEVKLGQDTTLCQGDTLLLIAGKDAKYTYAWNIGGQAPALPVWESRLYAVTVSNFAGCKRQDSIYVAFLASNSLSLGADTVFCSGASWKIQPVTPIPGGIYLWSTGETAPSLEITKSGEYSLTVHANGCTAQDTILVKTVECPECRIFIPNVFYPEGYAPNDAFGVYTDCTATFLHLRVFDRWGDLIYAGDNAGVHWDGTYKGRIMPPGVYLYTLEIGVVPANGAPTTEKRYGTVTLIR
jgi:gliding motility-associated-like protein